MEKMNLSFGFASRRPMKEKESPKYAFPYVEMLPPQRDKKGGISKFKLCNGAVELLNFDLNVEDVINRIIYSQMPKITNIFYLTNINNIPEKQPGEHKLNKDGSFNSSTLNSRICKDLDLDPTTPHYFTLLEVEATVNEYENLSIGQLVLIPKETEETTKVDYKETKEEGGFDKKEEVAPDFESETI